MNATPKGYRHLWKYKGVWDETKISPRKWKIDFKASKGKSARSYGSFKKGYEVVWKIKAIQRAKKTGKGRYQTRMIGTKTLIKSKNGGI